MRSFDDQAGRTWKIRIDAGALERVRADLGVDLMTAGPDFWDGLATDVPKLADVLYDVCKPQADAVGMRPIDFGRMLVGVIDAATTALIEAVIDERPTAVRKATRQDFHKRIKNH